MIDLDTRNVSRETLPQQFYQGVYMTFSLFSLSAICYTAFGKLANED